jgi:TatD-related deoxyribonuclease
VGTVAKVVPSLHAFPVIDDHCHLDRRGAFLKAVGEFHKAGGTHLIVVHKPDFDALPTTKAAYRDSLEATCALVDEVNKATPVVAWAAVAPHPVDIVQHFTTGMDIERAEALVLSGVEVAAELVAKGRAVALGEVGRPHFMVAPEILEAANRVFDRSMAMAKDLGCAVVVHTESTNPEVCLDIATRARLVGLDPGRVVKHYSPPLILPHENYGLMPSVLCSRPFCRESAKKGDRFMLETDYLDDPSRPGAVMALTTVPKRTYGLLQDGSFSEDLVHKVHEAWPERAYGVDIHV